MNGRLILLRIIFCGMIVGSIIVWSGVNINAQAEYNTIEISALNELAPKFGTYSLEGYVAKIYECPPCPEGAVCKPCMPHNIVISERKSELAQYALTDREIIVFLDQEQLEGLRVNRRYKFLVQVLDVKTTSQPINNVKLIFYERL